MLERYRMAEGDRVHLVETDEGILITPFDPAFAEALALYEEGAKGEVVSIVGSVYDGTGWALRDAMTVDKLDPCGIYFGTTGGQIYASSDGGDSWSAIVQNLPAVYSVEVQAVP